jgi:cellobiose phosphorylase
MTAGPDAPTPGEGKNSWLSGTAAWSFVTLSQYILGIRPDFTGLRIDPCIPTSWKKFTVVRKFRGTTYIITIDNPDSLSKGVNRFTLDGKVMSGNLIPDLHDGKEHTVEVKLGD